MIITFLTECNKNIGLGHLLRTLSIAYAYRSKGFNPDIIIDGDKNLVNIIDDSFNISFFSWSKNINRLIGLIDKTDILLIDSITLSNFKYKKIIDSKKNVLFIDDYHRWNHSKGIIVDWTIGVESNKPIQNSRVNYLLGAKYTALRKEFYDVKNKVHSKVIKNVMITFGGGDIRNMTPKIMLYIKEYYPNINLNVIIGKSYTNTKEIERIASQNTNLIYFPDATKIKNTMMKSDIAVASGGVTLYELARVGLPTIAIILIDNQIEDTEGWSNSGFLFNAGWWDNSKIKENIINLMHRLEDFSLREKMGKIGQGLVDGNGANRIVDYTLNRFYENSI